MAEIFDIGHESDLSEYDSTVTDSGDLSQSGSAALGGTSGGMQALIDDTTAIYGQKDFTQLTSTSYRFRCYVDPNGLTMSSGNSFAFASINRSGSGRCQAHLRWSGSEYQVYARAFDDSVSGNNTSFYTITDAPHFVEVLLVYASSAVASDATVTLWIDGVQQEELGGLDIYDLAKPDEARLGPSVGLDAGTSGTLYLDEFILRDDSTEIGPTGTVVAPSAVSMVMSSVDPTVVLGGITPTPVSMVMSGVDPTVSLGSLTITPSPVTMVMDTTGPQVLVPLVVSLLDPAGEHTQIAAAGDILQIKGSVSGSVVEMWAEVDSVVDQSTYYDYNVSIVDGVATAFPTGTTVINYGTSGEGVVRSVSDGTYQPYIEALTHAGSPYTAVTRHAIFGKLQELTSVDEWGIAVGADLDAFSDDYIVFSDGRFLVNTDLSIATGKGFQFADGGVSGYVLTDDGTGKVTLAAPTGGGISLSPLEGAIIYGDSDPAWAVKAHPGGANQHLESSALGLDWQTDITLADTSYIGLGGSSGRIEFDSTPTPDEVVVEDADFIARSNNSAFGPSISIDSNSLVYAERTFVDYDLDSVFGVYAKAIGSPGQTFDSNVVGVEGIAELSTAYTQSESALPYAGVYGAAGIANSVAGTLREAAGGQFTVDAEDGTIIDAYGILVETPHVDSGTVTTGYGVKIAEGTVGAGTLTTQYGLYIEAINNGGTNYAIYTNAGTCRFGGVVDASAASIRVEMDTTGVTDSGPTDSELDSIFGTPATVGSGFFGFVDDGGTHARIFGCVSDGTNWWWQRWFLAE